jgi:hypothetical protein
MITFFSQHHIKHKQQQPRQHTQCGIEITLLSAQLQQTLSIQYGFGIYVSPYVCFSIENEHVKSSVSSYNIDATNVTWSNEQLFLPCTFNSNNKLILSIEVLHFRKLLNTSVSLGYGTLEIDEQFIMNNTNHTLQVNLKKENEKCGCVNIQITSNDNDSDDNRNVKTIASDSIQSTPITIHNKNQFKDIKHRFKYEKQIGKGGAGTVWSVWDQLTNTRMAIKKISCESTDDVNRAIHEAWPIRSLDHPNIVKYQNVFFEDDNYNNNNSNFNVCFVMELYVDGDLHHHLQKRLITRNYYKEEQVLSIMSQLASGLSYLHSKSLLHRDLKPMNIFVKGENYLIGDFGLLRDVQRELSCTYAGTHTYMSPEIFAKKPYSLKSDLWSLGVTFLEIMCLHVDVVPYLEVYRNPTFYKDVETQLLTIGYSKEIITIVLQCLLLDPSQRPSAHQIHQQIDKLMNYEGTGYEDDEDGTDHHYRTPSSILHSLLYNNDDDDDNNTDNTRSRLTRSLSNFFEAI